MTVPSNSITANGQGVILDDQANTWVQTDQTAAQLRSFVGLAGMAVSLQGLAAPGDGGGGLFYWSAGNAYVDDGLSVIVPPAATGQGAWLRSRTMFPVPVYTVAGLPGVTAANAGQQAFASNGRNTGQGSSAGTGCPVFVNSAGIWCAVWSGVLVTS